MKARGPVAKVIANIMPAVSSVVAGAQTLRGSLSTSLPHERRNIIAVQADTLKKYEAARPRSPASWTKRSCAASEKAKSAAEAAKKSTCGERTSQRYETFSFGSLFCGAPPPFVFGSFITAKSPAAAMKGKVAA